MSSYLVTGCSRGLGLELVKQLLLAPASSVKIVIATSRELSTSGALDELLQSSQGRAHHVQLNVLDEESIRSAYQHARQILKDQGLDVLINNAGIRVIEDNGPCDMHALQSTLETNVVAVHKVSSTFIPLLQQGKQKKIVNITSTLGSIGLNDYMKMMPMSSYKISKTALNMLTVQYANDLDSGGFTVFCISPGWLRTDLGGPDADLAPDVGAKATMDIVYNSTKKDNGMFRDIFVAGEQVYSGDNPPW